MLPCKKPVSKGRLSQPFTHRILAFHASWLVASMSQQLIQPRARTSTQWMTNTSSHPCPATYSFDESPHLGFSNQMEPSNEYGRPYCHFWTVHWSVKAALGSVVYIQGYPKKPTLGSGETQEQLGDLSEGQGKREGVRACDQTAQLRLGVVVVNSMLPGCRCVLELSHRE